MDLFSDFCNICYKTDDSSLRDISQVNMKHLKDTLATFVGHADIILNHSVITLCQLCCEELTRCNKFRETCFTNLINLREVVFDMKSKLELEDDTFAVHNTLQIYVQEVLRRNNVEQINCAVSVPTEYAILKGSAELNKSDSIFNRQINLQSERNESTFACDYSAVEYDESQVAFTREEFDVNNEMLRHSESTAVLKFERESDVDFEITNEEFDVKNEIEINVSDFARRNYESESDGFVNVKVEMLPVNNMDEFASTEKDLHVIKNNSTSQEFKLETIEAEFADDLNVAKDVCTIVNMETCPQESMINEENAKGDIKLRRTVCKNKVTDTQPNHPSVKPHTCGVCTKSFKTSSCLTRHARTHNEDSPYKCSVCNKTFKQSTHLSVHERTHSGVRPYRCTVCNKAFKQSTHLSRHARTHNDDNPYKCTFCNKMFAQSEMLTAHERIHTDARPYKCNVCNKTFRHSTNLKVHELRHRGARPHKCTVCNKAFTESGTLTVHERIHSGARPYKCIVCNKTFTHAANLTVHERIHSGARPYKCTVCNKTFTQLPNLTRHKRIHTGNKL